MDDQTSPPTQDNTSQNKDTTPGTTPDSGLNIPPIASEPVQPSTPPPSQPGADDDQAAVSGIQSDTSGLGTQEPVSPVPGATDDTSSVAEAQPSTPAPASPTDTGLGAQSPVTGTPSDAGQTTPSQDTPALQSEPPATPTTPATPQDVTDQPKEPSDITDMAKPITPPAVAPGTDSGLVDQKPSELEKPAEPAGMDQPASDISASTPAPALTTSEPAVTDEKQAIGDTSSVTQSVSPQPTQPTVGQPVSPTEEAKPEETTTQPSQQSGIQPASVPGVIQSDQGVGDSQDLQKTHEPIIVLPEEYEMGQTVPVKVKVGMVSHPMEEPHHIQSIELFANNASVGKSELKPSENPVAEADFQVPLSAGLVLRAEVNCNMHGNWKSEKKVEMLPSKGN